MEENNQLILEAIDEAKYYNGLCGDVAPKNFIEEYKDNLYFQELLYSALVKRKVLTKKEQKIALLKMNEFTYFILQNEERIKNNEKLKKHVEVLFLNEYLSFVGLGKIIRISNSQ